MRSGIKGHDANFVSIDEIADMAMETPAEDYKPLETAPPPANAAPTLVRCVGCRGTGIMRGRLSFLWGDNCWLCAGWGRNFPAQPFRGPFRANPVRVLMQSMTSPEAT